MDKPRGRGQFHLPKAIYSNLVCVWFLKMKLILLASPHITFRNI